MNGKMLVSKFDFSRLYRKISTFCGTNYILQINYIKTISFQGIQKAFQNLLRYDLLVKDACVSII